MTKDVEYRIYLFRLIVCWTFRSLKSLQEESTATILIAFPFRIIWVFAICRNGEDGDVRYAKRSAMILLLIRICSR